MTERFLDYARKDKEILRLVALAQNDEEMLRQAQHDNKDFSTMLEMTVGDSSARYTRSE